VAPAPIQRRFEAGSKPIQRRAAVALPRQLGRASLDAHARFESWHRSQMLFDDVADDDLDLGPDAADRAFFACIESRGEVGDLPVDEAWAVLADRYADDLRLRIVALARESEAHGTANGRTEADYARALETLRPRVAKLAEEERAPFEALEVFVQDALGRAADDAFRRARRTIRRLEQALLEEAATKTAGGRPFGERSSPVRIDDAALLAKAKGEIRQYSPKVSFAPGDRVSHVKFGLGLVTAREEGKVEVAFADGRKKLASA
jgi:hypothetical protein